MTDRATPMLDQAINKPYYGDANTRIFNFNTYQCYDSSLDGHLSYFDVLDCDATIYVDKKAKTLAWGTNIPRKETGVQLRLSTIPGVVYHIFFTGQLTMGNQVFMRIKNRNPILYLTREVTWKIGDQETESVCFRALSHQTDLIMFTDKDCVQDLAPFAFTIFHLNIIPECFMCKGYVEGPPGLSGPQGEPGVVGQPGITFTGPSGPTGPSGVEGPTGSLGPQGSDGPIGPIGPIGPPGVQGQQQGNQGPVGRTGQFGFGGQIGALGPTGVQGGIGPRGNPADGMALGPGPDGVTGPTGPQGDPGDIGPTGPANGGEVSSGSFVIEFVRNPPGPPPDPPEPVLVTTSIEYDQIGNQVTITILGFVVGAGGLDNVPITGFPIVAGIIPGGGPRILNPIITISDTRIIPSDPPTSETRLIHGSLSADLALYQNLAGDTFRDYHNIEFPTQTFSYII